MWGLLVAMQLLILGCAEIEGGEIANLSIDRPSLPFNGYYICHINRAN